MTAGDLVVYREKVVLRVLAVEEPTASRCFVANALGDIARIDFPVVHLGKLDVDEVVILACQELCRPHGRGRVPTKRMESFLCSEREARERANRMRS